jgi:4-hydroxymandelate oxidase
MTEAVAAVPVNVHEYEAAARAVLSPMVYEFIAGGAGDEETLRSNREAFRRWRLLPRVLTGPGEVELATTVLGQPVALPVLIAPTGLHGQVHPDGELATARAARSAGTIYTLSTASNYAIEQVAPVAGPWWFQLYVFTDRGITRDLVARAEAAGAAAIVVTVDVPRLGRREADERNRYHLAPGLTMANLESAIHRLVPAADGGSGMATYVGSLWDASLSWRDLDWLASITTLPVVPKGILHPDDAVQAVTHGARAIIVSNHGGRQLDGAIAALDALPAVVEAAGDRAEVLLDGGIRRGTDVIKALALGARAILIGRPLLWGLAVGGEAGASHVLSLLRAELELDLLLCGLKSSQSVPRSAVV